MISLSDHNNLRVRGTTYRGLGVEYVDTDVPFTEVVARLASSRTGLALMARAVAIYAEALAKDTP